MADERNCGWGDAERHALLLGASLTPLERFKLLEQMQEFAWKTGAWQKAIERRLRAVDELWEKNSKREEKS